MDRPNGMCKNEKAKMPRWLTTSARAGAAMEPNLLMVAHMPNAALLVDVGNISDVYR